MRAGDLETARRELLRSLKLGPNPLTWSALGELHENAGHPDDAFAAYDQALAMSPEFVLALDRSAFLALRLGDLERAEATLARAVAAAPERDDLRHSLQDLRRRLAVPPSTSQ
jgi:tetratricopeptide (TPR) repeat protein